MTIILPEPTCPADPATSLRVDVRFPVPASRPQPRVVDDEGRSSSRNCGVQRRVRDRVRDPRRFLARFAETALVVDESSLASTVQARDLARVADEVAPLSWPTNSAFSVVSFTVRMRFSIFASADGVPPEPLHIRYGPSRFGLSCGHLPWPHGAAVPRARTSRTWRSLPPSGDCSRSPARARPPPAGRSLRHARRKCNHAASRTWSDPITSRGCRWPGGRAQRAPG